MKGRNILKEIRKTDIGYYPNSKNILMSNFEETGLCDRNNILYLINRFHLSNRSPACKGSNLPLKHSLNKNPNNFRKFLLNYNIFRINKDTYHQQDHRDHNIQYIHHMDSLNIYHLDILLYNRDLPTQLFE